jgi:hypothetical protein
MKVRHIVAALAFLGFLASLPATAAAPNCYSYNGTGYCEYTGKVYQVYVNSGGQIILYFDTPMTASQLASVGISGVSVLGAAMFNIAESPDYAKMLYASLLAAQARGSNVQVQLWGTTSGYMKIDRIWVHQ